MGQHKFEKEIGRKLRDRKIKPQEKSWEELSSRLEKEDKRSVSIFWFAGIAASLTAAFLLFNLVFINPQVSPPVVDAPSEVIEKPVEESSMELQQITSKEVVVAEEPAPEKDPSEAIHKKQEIIRQKTEKPSLTELAEVTKVQPTLVEEIKGTAAPELIEEEILPSRLEEVIAEISRADDTQDLTENEVDALLYKAASEISMNRQPNKFSGKVDATALLMDVEMELDQTFRERVFDVLKEGYLKARTAVVNRNF